MILPPGGAMVRQRYLRASRHMPTKVELHCSWAAWEERHGCGGEASRILESLEESCGTELGEEVECGSLAA